MTFNSSPPNGAYGSAVEFVNLSKRFGSVLANDNVSFAIPIGTVHGVIGENGAGKSTLMSALFGIYQPDSGKVLVHGKPVRINNPAHAISHGIGMVHQHFMLVERLSALQNIVLGCEGAFWLGRSLHEARARILHIQQKYGLPFPIDVPVRELPVGVQQRVEIVKTLYRGADILILDEPTSVLTPQEVQALFEVFRELASEGKTVVLITHKLQEIVDVTSNVTVLRHGRVIGTKRTAETTKGQLAEMMVGRKVQNATGQRIQSGNEFKVAVERLTVTDALGVSRVSDLSFDIRASEILGVAGVSGNGQTELIACLAGQIRPQSGSIRLGSLAWSAAEPVSTLAIRKAGVALVPEDRLRHAVVGSWTARDNSVLGIQRSGKIPGVGLRMQVSKLTTWCRDLMEKHDIRPVDPMRRTSVFSGGNQQKLVMARELSTDPDVIVVGQPTRGVDVGAIEAIHTSLMTQRNDGKALLVVSVELEEVMALADRILVMFEGRSMGVLERHEFDENTIGLMMAGSSREEAVVQKKQEMLP